jgi:hypothetical protein
LLEDGGRDEVVDDEVALLFEGFELFGGQGHGFLRAKVSRCRVRGSV